MIDGGKRKRRTILDISLLLRHSIVAYILFICGQICDSHNQTIRRESLIAEKDKKIALIYLLFYVFSFVG